MRGASARGGKARLPAHLAEAVSDVTGYGDHIRRFVRNQRAKRCAAKTTRLALFDRASRSLVWTLSGV